MGDYEGNNLHLIKLIDFGLCSSYVDASGQHNPEHQSLFSGNIAFGSKNTLNNMAASRRDDLISLVYLLFYIHTGSLSFLGLDQVKASDDEFIVAKALSTP